MSRRIFSLLIARTELAGYRHLLIFFARHATEMCLRDSSCSALCIGFILSNRAVSTVLAGCRTRKQLRENVQAVETGLPADLLDRLHEISAPIAALCGANCDLWQWNSRVW